LKSIIPATILLLWMGCFFNCSAEQFGMRDCAIEACGDCDRGDDPPQDDSNDAPCGLCDFIAIGGAPTISPLVLDTPDAEKLSPPASLTAANQAGGQPKLPPAAVARGSCFADGVLAEPCELLARGTAPVRGPTPV